MSDFKQHGPITTLHRLPGYSLEHIEKELRRFAKRQPMTLILPSLFSELEGERVFLVHKSSKNVFWGHHFPEL